MHVKCLNDHVNPFDIVLDRIMLINLSSESEMETPAKLLSLQQDGITLAKEFIQVRLLLFSKKFFDPIPRNINKSTMVKKKFIAKRNSLTTVEVSRDILKDLLCLKMKSAQVIDFKEALKYPLSLIPLSLSFPDSTKRSPAKSSLMKIIGYTKVVQDDAYANAGAYILDPMAVIQAIGSFSTVEELINRVLSIILRDCGRVALVADSYKANTTRAARREESFTILESVKVKIQDANVFLHENENKSQLIKLFLNWLIDNRRKTLNTLRTTSLYLSTEGYCLKRLSISDVRSIDSLVPIHEKADFRLMVHAKYAIDSNSPVIIRSHSGDTDIFIMTLTSFYSTNSILDSGTGAGRKIL